MSSTRIPPIFPLAAIFISSIVLHTFGRKDGNTVAETPPPPAQPEVPNRFVFHPRFQTSDMEFSAGSGFFIQSPVPGRPLLFLTALHVIGPSGGYHRQVSATDLRSTITGLGLREAFLGESASGAEFDVLPLFGSAPLGEPSVAGDIAAVSLHSGAGFQPGVLANTRDLLQPGDELWLGAVGDDSAKRTHRAVVFEGSEKDLYYWFDDSGVEIARRERCTAAQSEWPHRRHSSGCLQGKRSVIWDRKSHIPFPSQPRGRVYACPGNRGIRGGCGKLNILFPRVDK